MTAPVPSRGELRVEELPAAALGTLEEDWWGLWRRTPDATPFQSPAWLIPWWRRFGTAEAVLLAVRAGGGLIGLLPLYRLDEPGVRKLLPLGIGVSDYLDPLLDPAYAGSAVGPALEHLARRGGFDRFDYQGLSASSPLLRQDLPAGWSRQEHQGEPAPVLDLAAQPTPLRSRLAKLPYYRRRAERLGEVALLDASPGTIPALLEALYALHGRRWAGRGEPGVLVDPSVRAFHREAAVLLHAQGLLRLFGLRLAGRMVAVFYGFADGARAYAYIGGHDPTLPHPGLGALMIGQAIERAIRDGAREFHFLRGREPYKYSWGATDRPLYGCRLVPDPAQVGLRKW